LSDYDVADGCGTPLKDLNPYFIQDGEKRKDVFLWFFFLGGAIHDHSSRDGSYTCPVVILWPVKPERGPLEVPASAADRLALMKELGQGWAKPFYSVVSDIPSGTEPIT